MTEMQDGFTIVRSMIDHLEERAEQEPELVRAMLVRVTSLLRAQGPRPVKAGNKPRGLGYDIDEAMIMAFRHEFDGSIEQSARAHWEGEDEDIVDAKIRRLYRHKKEIDDVGQGGDY